MLKEFAVTLSFVRLSKGIDDYHLSLNPACNLIPAIATSIFSSIQFIYSTPSDIFVLLSNILFLFFMIVFVFVPLSLLFLTPGQTPMRDQFGLNDMHSDSFSVSDAASVSSRYDKVRVT